MINKKHDLENHNGIEQSLIAQKWEDSELTNFGFIDDLDSRMSVSNLPLSEEPESELDDLEQRKKFFLDPKNQAEILITNYILSNPNIVMTGREMRNLKRTFLARAKKGKYRKIFLEVAERNA